MSSWLVRLRGTGGYHRRLWLPLLLVAVFVIGLALGRGGRDAGPADHVQTGDVAQAETWTCSMHPQIQRAGPGLCPLCGMDLIPVEGATSGSGSTAELVLSEAARKLAAVEVRPAQRRFVETEIRMVGKITYDETRLAYITARMPGRLDRLYVDYVGMPVREGDHLAELYSPDLLVAQEELIQAVRAVRGAGGDERSVVGRSARANVGAAREKLRLWGLTADQIAEIERREHPSDHVTIYAPRSGIVVAKDAVEGMYVQTGTVIYTIADLSQVWAKLDAYESDLAWVRYGQAVELYTEAYPGDAFHGKIVFVDPVVNARTRTVKVRVNVPNLEGKLKPEMFVRGRVSARIAAGGRVMDPDLAGKWISPMHPEVVKDGPGKCDVCGMPLVPAETLGYISADATGAEAPLVIPATAPLITGKRAIVYVADPEAEGTYRGREIELGPRAGDAYIVRGGLSEGELVVVRGNFKIDSAIQIMAGRSMMNPDAEGAPTGHQHAEPAAAMREQLSIPADVQVQLDRVWTAYFGVQRALSLDDVPKAKSVLGELLPAVAGVDASQLSRHAADLWRQDAKKIRAAAERLRGAADIAATRVQFEALSLAITAAVRSFGSTADHPILRYHCPMAFDWRGADWLQDAPGTANPYFGSAMFRCGSEEEVLWAGSAGGADE